jgi:hypothetical protein
VRQQLWVRRVELNAGKGKVVTVTCIVAREHAAPAGVKPIEWRLLTNRAAASAAEVAELIDWYRARWEIEMLFNVLKNGCKVEELQLGTVERIERALALYLVVAWRIAHLMRMGRTCSDLDAKLFFDPDEIRPSYRRSPGGPRDCCRIARKFLFCTNIDIVKITVRPELATCRQRRGERDEYAVGIERDYWNIGRGVHRCPACMAARS